MVMYMTLQLTQREIIWPLLFSPYRQKTVSASFIVLTVLYILKCSPVCRASWSEHSLIKHHWKRLPYHYSIEELSPAYSIDRVIPYLRINEILGYYYNIRNSGYNFKGETHNYFELTYVDRGCMKTIVDGKDYEL